MSESIPKARSPEGNAWRFKSAAGLRFAFLVLFTVVVLDLGGFQGVSADCASPCALDLGPIGGTGTPPNQEAPTRQMGASEPYNVKPARIQDLGTEPDWNARDGEDMKRVQDR